MAASLIQQSADPFTDPTLEKLYLDPVLNPGSRFLFDFLNPISNPNADGVLPGGTTFKNLVEGGADAVYTPNSGGSSPLIAITNAAGKAGLVSAGQKQGLAVQPQISMGAPQPTADKPFAVSLWVKQAGAANNGAQDLGAVMLGDVLEAAGAAGTPYYNWALYSMFSPVNGATMGQRLSGSPMIGPGVIGSTAVRQLGVSWVAGTLTGYVNGAVIGSQAGIPSPIAPTGVAPRLFLTAPGTYYRAYMERLDQSLRTAAAAIKADYDLNAGRFA